MRGEAARGLAEFGDKSLAPRLAQLLEGEYDLGYYYRAAEILGDPALLPVVKASAEKWKASLPEGRKFLKSAISAIEVLEKAGG